MNVWGKFEEDCTLYLIEQFGEYAKFTHQGKSDSTIPDIKVETNKNKQFYIEAKHSPAQCGQFVLLPNIETKKFEYSKMNSTMINDYSAQIINHMNNHFEEFKEAGTAGKTIAFENCNEVFNQWIIKTYKDKGVKFFITNNYVMLPIEKFADYFNVSAKYRIKRSGSNSVGSGNIDKVVQYLTAKYPGIKLKSVKDKVFIYTEDNLHNERFIIGKNEYMISKRDDNYEVRKLSNTFNANVIFSIELKTNESGISVSDFIFILLED